MFAVLARHLIILWGEEKGTGGSLWGVTLFQPFFISLSVANSVCVSE